MIELPPLNIPDLLRQHGIHPDKRLGQNFLVDHNALKKITAVAEIDPADTVLEIGAGLGNLTRMLAAQANRVVAIELDKRLVPVLRQVLNPYPNVEIVQGDILTIDPAALFSVTKEQRGYLVVANIPYYITSAVIRHLLEAQVKPGRIVLTIQREVAQRICAEPGDLSLLALSVQVYGHPRLAAQISAGAFYPSPQVDSAVVRIDLYPEPIIPTHLIDCFFQVIKAGFSQKRKNLRNALAGGLNLPPAHAKSLLEGAGIDSRRRAETLNLQEWEQICQVLSAG